MRASGSQGPQVPQTTVVKNQVYLHRRGNTSLSSTTQSRTEKRRNPRPLSFTSPSTHLPNSSRSPVNDTNPISKSVCASPTGNVPVNKLTSANGGSSSFVAAKSPLDKNSLPAFYSEQTLIARSISQEDQKSSLENLISVISSVLKNSNETGVHCPVTQPSLQPIDPLKSYRNINHVKELNDKLAQLESENFKLKLKLFYLEEERNKGGYSVESNQNINLQVELQEVKSDLAKRNELLKETLLHLNNFDKDFDKRTQSPGTGKSSETCLRDKTTSEDESLVSQGNCATIAEDSIATSNIESQVRDRDWLKSSLNRLMNEALTIAPNLTNLIENTKKTFNLALSNAKTVESEDRVNIDMDIDLKNKRIEALESELKKYQELDCSIPTRDTPISHEVEQELRSLHQAVIEKDRLYQEAIKEKCSILKESEERCKSIIAVAQERSEEAQRLNAQLQEMRNEYESTKKLVEESKNSVAVLEKQNNEMIKAMENEVKEKNRILSEAEVLDQMQNEQSQELAKLKTRLSNLQELHQRTLDEAHDKECNLKETRQKLIDVQNQLEMIRNQSKVAPKEMSSIMWDASSIHNQSALEISPNLMEQSTIGEFLKSFQGTETNHLLLNHIYELEKFLHKLLTCENPSDLLSQGSFTPVYVDSLRKALVGADGTLDASQSGISLMLLERTYEALPLSMINADLPEIDKAETESDGATRDRDMSDMSVNSYTKRVDKGDQDVGDSLNGTLFARRLRAEKAPKNHGACVGNGEELEPLVSRIENTVEALSRELAKFQNENPHLILRLLDMLKENDGNTFPSLLEGQILSSFEILGGKMDLLGKTMNDVNIAARTLAEYFNSQSSPKSGIAKEILSPLNLCTSNKNTSPLLERSLSGPIGAQGRIDPPSYHKIKRSLDNEVNPRQSDASVDENLSTLRDCYNQLVESLRSSLDWMKSVNDSEINEAIEQQEIINLLNNSYTMNKDISSANYSDELRKLNQMLPDWVHLNRSLFQTLVKSLRGKNQLLKAHEEQIITLNRNLETKFKELKQVQDWNLRLQNELDNEKLALGSTLQKLSSVQEAFDAASEEVKSKMDTNAKMWDENKILKSSIESRVSDSGALKELCHKLQEELKLKQTERDDLKAELNKAHCEIQNADTQRKVLENHLKREYENHIIEFKNQIDNLTQSRQKIQSENDEMFTELKNLRKESARRKETESCFRTSYETLEKQLEEKTNELESLISSKEKEALKRTSLEENLRETLKLKINMENDCQLLGERLNEIQRKNREMASQLKSTKDILKCRENEKETLRQNLKDLEAKYAELRLKTNATVESESLRIAQSTQNYVETQDQVENKMEVLENEIDNYKRNEYSMKQALLHEKEKLERYKKNLAYAKLLLKQKGVGLKSTSLSGLSIEALDEVCDATKDLGKSSKSHFYTETSTQTCEIQKDTQSFSVQCESVEPNLESIIQGLLEETNSLKADLEKTTKVNKELSDKIKEYECYSDDPKILRDDFVDRPGPLDHFIPSAASGITQPQTDWTLTNLVNQNSSPGNLGQMYMERDALGSSESLLHSRVIEQLGTQVTSRAFAGFNCISNEVPVRDIDNDMVCGMRNVAPDFQSSNEEIQTIISGVGGVNARRSPRSVYSSPDLGIESDPNRERGWSGSPSLDNNHLNKNISPQIVTKAANSAFKQDQAPINVVASTGHDSNLVVICPLGELVLLTKEVEESVAILEGIKARIKDRILTLTQRTNGSSPAKTLEYSTLKEVDSSCYKLQVCLCRSIALINIFSAEPKKLDSSETNTRDNVLSLNSDLKDRQELERLRLLYDEQSEKLKEALATLDFYQKRKENVEKAISRQLSKTKRVLRKAKGNLLEEKKIVDIPQAAVPDVSVANIKTIASTPMVKSNK